MVAVHIGCPCPGTPHAEGDDVYLRPRLGLKEGIAVQRLIIDANKAERMDAAVLTGLLAEAYLLNGVEGWTLVDEGGKPVPVGEDTIRSHLLSDFALSAPIADAADDLYMQAVIGPLLVRASTSSPATPTNGSTSPTRKARTKKAKPSSPSTQSSSPTPTLLKPSSTTSTQTAFTGTTLVARAGGSSS